MIKQRREVRRASPIYTDHRAGRVVHARVRDADADDDDENDDDVSVHIPVIHRGL